MRCSTETFSHREGARHRFCVGLVRALPRPLGPSVRDNFFGCVFGGCSSLTFTGAVSLASTFGPDWRRARGRRHVGVRLLDARPRARSTATDFTRFHLDASSGIWSGCALAIRRLKGSVHSSRSSTSCCPTLVTMILELRRPADRLRSGFFGFLTIATPAFGTGVTVQVARTHPGAPGSSSGVAEVIGPV